MKKIIILTILLSVFLVSPALAVDDGNTFAEPLTEAYIKYERMGWQNYEFWVIGNLSNEDLKYEWSIDRQQIYNTKSVRAFLSRGPHVIKLKVEDKYGNVIYDTVRLEIRFWSLQNSWFWWLMYILVVLVILYYWIVKLIYLFNRRRLSKRVRFFLNILDEHGWVEGIVERYNRQHKIEKNKKRKK